MYEDLEEHEEQDEEDEEEDPSEEQEQEDVRAVMDSLICWPAASRDGVKAWMLMFFFFLNSILA